MARHVKQQPVRIDDGAALAAGSAITFAAEPAAADVNVSSTIA